MVLFNDIYFKIGSKLFQKNFFELDIKNKKELVDKEIKNYIIQKMRELGFNDVNIKLTTLELFEELSNSIPKENHFDTIRHFTHYILDLAGTLQGYSIVWFMNDDISSPVVDFENNTWSKLETKNEDYKNIFYFVYNVFNSTFLNQEKNLIYKNN